MFLDWKKHFVLTCVKSQNSVVKKFLSSPKLSGPNQIILVQIQIYFGPSEEQGIMQVISTYSVDSIKRTVHLAFHGLFSLLKILFTISKQYF